MSVLITTAEFKLKLGLIVDKIISSLIIYFSYFFWILDQNGTLNNPKFSKTVLELITRILV